MADELSFDFEAGVEQVKRIEAAQQAIIIPPDLPAEAIGQQPGNYRKNFRKVCSKLLSISDSLPARALRFLARCESICAKRSGGRRVCLAGLLPPHPSWLHPPHIQKLSVSGVLCCQIAERPTPALRTTLFCLQTVCTYWLRNMCMKGDTCGFLHQFDPEKMPVSSLY